VRNLIDCHMHTALCGHATGIVEDYVKAGVKMGLLGMAMTEHMALPRNLDQGRHLSMRPRDLEDYMVEVEFARTQFPQISIATGLEADYLRGREAETATALDAARDYNGGVTFVLGSVHFIGDWAFDDPNLIDEWEYRDVDAAWRDYFELWCEAAGSGLFDAMAHPDLIKKFGYFPSFDPRGLYAKAARCAADAGVAIEVSTAGLRRPVAELYPGPELLSAFASAGVRATVGSDAHDPLEVGYRIDAALDALLAAGYQTFSLPDGSGQWKELTL
jgi:histidinol-phosphatase (PHP family)